ncbi:hypothetical protein K0M31_002509 [Melipona bicolor]|uniref:Uncharacterized protein n=1 Tax=Melipona bicolor TaxID=60889 RepID=A0AA40KYX6_9HYME|nr:hypothetical protein K0M31_002509 [Melipona bicolor]
MKMVTMEQVAEWQQWKLTFLGEDHFNDDLNLAVNDLHHDNVHQQQEKVEDFVTIILISACEHISAKNLASGHLLLLLKKTLLKLLNRWKTRSTFRSSDDTGRRAK